MTDNFTDGRYNADTKDTLLDALISDAESQTAFGKNFDPDELSIIRAFYDPVAERLAELQEDIGIVMDSSQIDHAEGAALDLLAAWIGVVRKDAQNATGRVSFSRSNRATQDYVIPAATTVQTESTDPIKYETDNAVTLAVLDNFEDNDISDYNGDTADFNVQTGTVQDGTYALEATAAAGSKIWTTTHTFGSGSEWFFRLNIGSTSEASFLFGVEDGDNYYEARVDNNNGNIEIGYEEDGGGFTSINSTAATIPDGEWLDCRVKWEANGDITLDVDDANNSDVASLTVNDTRFDGDGLGFGFKTVDANAAKYFDSVEMKAVGAAITAVESGASENVGANVLTEIANTPGGVESVTNQTGTSGGEDEEEDDDFRERAKSELGDGIRGTQTALIERLESQDYVTNVSVIENDTSSTDGDGRPAHSFEAVVQTDSEHYADVAQVILDTKSSGIESVGGYDGTSQTETADLPNDQTKNITFSTPTEVLIYMDIDLTKDSTYAGDDGVRDNVVRYIGGTLSSGATEDGELDPGDDVIYNQVMAAIASTQGVVDVTNLEIDTDTTPTNTSNETIADTSIATADATDSSMDVNSSDA